MSKQCNHPLCGSECRKKKPKKPRKPIKKRSDKRAKQEREYSRKAKEYKMVHPHCEARISEDCTGWTSDVHHKAGRENHLLTDDSLFMGLCRNCHEWVHSNPGKAREVGLLKRA